MKTKENTATITASPSTVQGPTWGDVTAAAPVLTAAMWCSSVGTTWTLELHTWARRTAYGTLVDWISSGIPITQPVPANRLARELLTERGLYLLVDSTVEPNADSRHGIGYVCADAELITLAHRIRDEAVESGVHPVVLAAQRIATGYIAGAGSRRNTAGRWPGQHAARTRLPV
jgi:hypothetical protein